MAENQESTTRIINGVPVTFHDEELLIQRCIEMFDWLALQQGSADYSSDDDDGPTEGENSDE